VAISTSNMGSTLEATEVLDSAATPAASSPQARTVTQNAYNTAVQGTPTTTPAVTGCSFKSDTVGGGGTTDIDLTSMPGVTATQTANAKKVQGFKFLNDSDSPLVLTPGPSNGYELGGAGWSETVWPGGEYFVRTNNGPAAVDGTHKIIRVTGTAGKAFRWGLTFG
jgi:hypothetical protein